MKFFCERIHVEQDAHIASSSGDQELLDLNIAGKAVVRSSSGDVEGVRLAFGTLDASTSSGEVELSQMQAQDILVHTASGSCALECLDFQALEATTASGSIQLYIPPDTGFAYSTHTYSGGVSVRFPIRDLEETERFQRSGVVGDGSRRIAIKSASGSISIRPIRA